MTEAEKERNRRDEASKVMLTLRISEALRKELETRAKASKVSLNNEIIRRVELSLAKEDRAGSQDNAELLRVIENVIYTVTAARGRDWKNNESIRRSLRSGILEVMNFFVPVSSVASAGILANTDEARAVAMEALRDEYIGQRFALWGVKDDLEAIKAESDAEINRLEAEIGSEVSTPPKST
jgi:hypothetical protein